MRCYIAQQLHTKWRIALIDKLMLAVFRKLIKARLSGSVAYGRCFGGIIVRPDAKKDSFTNPNTTAKARADLLVWFGLLRVYGI